MFNKAIVRAPCARFAEGLTTSDQGAPNHARALEQHAEYCAALEECGLTVTRLDADELYPDSTFVEDTAVIVEALPDGRAIALEVTKQNPAREQGRRRANGETTDALPDGLATAPCAILARPGAATRVGEVENMALVLSRSCAELHSIREPGMLDGGDVCEAADHFFIGVSERTNETGAQQLTKFLASNGYTSTFVDIRGVKNVLHLKSGLAFLGDNRLAVIDALADHPAFRVYDLVRVDATEEYAANCVRVNDRVLVAAGYPGFEQTLQDLGYKTLAVGMTEFQKMDGGLSCLSLRF
jgi:dimethylargininase